jgi:hypothetical protein
VYRKSEGEKAEKNGFCNDKLGNKMECKVYKREEAEGRRKNSPHPVASLH